MRKIALPTLSALALLGAMTPHAWAGGTSLIPDVPIIPKFKLNVVPNLNVLPNANAIPDAPVVRAPDAPPVIYEHLPADISPNDLPTPPLDKPKSNYVNLQDVPDSPRLGGAVQSNPPNPVMGVLPTDPNAPKLNYTSIRPELPVASPNRPLPPNPGAPPSLPPRPDLPIAYSNAPPGAADAAPGNLPGNVRNNLLGVLEGQGVDVTPRAPRPVVPQQPLDLGIPRAQALSEPTWINNLPTYTPKKTIDWKKVGKVVGTTLGVTVVVGVVVGVGVSVPAAIEEITCQDLPSDIHDKITWAVKGYYLSTEGGKRVVRCDSSSRSLVATELRVGKGAKPEDCPPGYFYTTDITKPAVKACDDDTTYALMPAPGGAKMANGNPYPAGVYLLEKPT